MLPDGKKISSKQLMQQSRKSCLFPFTATGCKMLREARGRSEVRQWARTELSVHKEALSRGSPRPIVTSDLCFLIQRTLILAAVAGCCYFSLHLFIIHLFKGGVLLRLRASLWLLKFDPGLFAFMQMISIGTVFTRWASKRCNSSRNSHQYTQARQR